MADILIMKAVEYDNLPVKFRKKYTNLQTLHDAGWWVQRKYDGCFGMAVLKADGTSQMLSRTGEDYTASCGHILIELRDAAGSDAACVIIGEVWQPISEATFPVVSGRFRRQRPSPELRFVANDLLPAGLVTPIPYKARHMALFKMLPDEGDEYATIVAETHGSHDWPSAADALAVRWVAEGGFDGAILRDPNAGYTIGMVKAGEIVKVKPTVTFDLEVVGVVEGVGKHKGRLGALTVRYKGKECNVGTGFDDLQRTAFWLSEQVIGLIVEVEAMGETPDGKLREPRFIRIRHDKDTPDF